MSMSILARNIEQRKRDLGIAKSIDLANKSGVSRAVLTNIRKMPTKSIMLDSAVHLAKALECRLEWLATGEGSPTTDEYVEAVQLSMGAPLVTLNQLVNVEDTEDYIANGIGAHAQRLPCPSGNASSQFVVKVNEQIKNFPAGGYIYFDTVKVPISGQLVVANTGNNVEIMEYQSAHGRQFLKSLNEDLPLELRLVEIDEQQLIGTFSAYTLF
ncbi:helix-turn-helix domain-containing protein [Vibrio harveyi]|uniref:helix-turn-helix domain-containing protein n=1 Tax=Vibrio harveyi TaxID=669 RepID=UPI003BB48F76